MTQQSTNDKFVVVGFRGRAFGGRCQASVGVFLTKDEPTMSNDDADKSLVKYLGQRNNQQLRQVLRSNQSCDVIDVKCNRRLH